MTAGNCGSSWGRVTGFRPQEKGRGVWTRKPDDWEEAQAAQREVLSSCRWQTGRPARLRPRCPADAGRAGKTVGCRGIAFSAQDLLFVLFSGPSAGELFFSSPSAGAFWHNKLPQKQGLLGAPLLQRLALYECVAWITNFHKKPGLLGAPLLQRLAL